MSKKIYGAGAAVWLRLGDTCLREDLLPVVSNLDATISPTSRMQGLGKTPSWYNGSGNVAGISNWTDRLASEQDIARWSKQDDYGICIQTRHLRALDVDVEDVHSAEMIRYDIVEFFRGYGFISPPCRMRSNSGKLLIPFFYDDELYKRNFKCKLGGIVEMLATGQQFVAYGTHPSGVRYEWEGRPELAPTLDAVQLESLWAILVERYAVPDSVSEGRKARESSGVHRPDIDDPVYQYLEANGMVLDLDDRKGHAHIICPFEDDHGTHTLTSTTYMLKGSAGYEAGHFSCLHASCGERSDNDFLHKCGYTASRFDSVESLAQAVADGSPASSTLALLDDPPTSGDDVPLIDLLLPPADPPGRRVDAQYDPVPASVEASEDWPTFFRNKNGEIDATVDNVVRALGCFGMCGVRVNYDEFLNRIVVDDGSGLLRRLTDVDYTGLRIVLERRGFKPISQEMARHAVAFSADKRRINSAQAWLNSLAWDGVGRVRALMSECYKVVSDLPYAEAVGLYLMTALAARVLYPGCKADMVPVLTSEQGMVKTSAVEALAPFEEAFGELDLSKGDDDIARLLSGKLVVEMAELKGLRSKEIEHLRSFITRRYEEWVPKFQENPIRVPRTCVFIGTTNEFAMLVDTQGNRRWLPCVVEGHIDVQRVREQRDQLWAEGAEIVRQRVAKGLDPVAWEEVYPLGREKQASHEVADPIEEAVLDWLQADCVEFGGEELVKNCEKPFSLSDLLNGVRPAALKGVSSSVLGQRVPNILRKLGYVSKNVKVDKQTVRKMWMRELL